MKIFQADLGNSQYSSPRIPLFSASALVLFLSTVTAGYSQVLEEYRGSTLTNVYNYGEDLISQRTPEISTNYFILDGHSSTRMLTDHGGIVVNVLVYDAYGNLIASNNTLQTAYLYSGQQFDSDLGLYYNRARYLNTGTGRFWTADLTEGQSEDPLSLHKYLYAEDESVDNTDPSGNDVDSFAVNIGSIGVDLATIGASVTSETGLGVFSPVSAKLEKLGFGYSSGGFYWDVVGDVHRFPREHYWVVQYEKCKFIVDGKPVPPLHCSVLWMGNGILILTDGKETPALKILKTQIQC